MMVMIKLLQMTEIEELEISSSYINPKKPRDKKVTKLVISRLKLEDLSEI